MTPRRVALALAGAALLAFLLWPEAPAGPTGGWLAQAGLEPRVAVVKGIRVRYVRSGHGPAVVLVHGLGSSLYTWKDVLAPLAAAHDVVALDLPGFGQSDLPPNLAGAILPEVVLGLMDDLGLPKASLVGHSLGGAVATVVAARNPDRVERLVLLDAAGFNLAATDRPWLLRLIGSRGVGSVLARLPRKRLLVTLALRQVFFDPRRVTAERVEEYLAPLARPGAVRAVRSLLSSGRLGLGGSFEDAARAVRAPTLVVWGRDDAWVPPSDADRFLAAVAGSRKIVLSECGHVPQEEHPEEVSSLLADFLTPPAWGP